MFMTHDEFFNPYNQVDIINSLLNEYRKMLRVLPVEKHNEKHIQKRKKLAKEVDPNGNGIISLAETQKAVRDVFKFAEMFKYKSSIN